MNRAAVYVLSLAVALAMLSPVLRRPPVDSFPLSTYPMFANPRPPVAEFDAAYGVTDDGDLETLSPTLIAGDPWPTLSVEVLARARVGGNRARSKTCREIAGRVAESSREDLVAVVLVRERHDVRRYFRGRERPLARTRLARCLVPR